MNPDLMQTPFQGHFADVNGLKMYYEIYGDGTPLILLHGFTDSTVVWHPFIDEFAKHFRIIVPDLRGHGRSLDLTNQFTLAQVALDVFILLDQLGIGQFKAIGVSAGGCSLLYMASQQPARLEAIILESSPAYFSEQALATLLAGVTDEVLDLHPQRHYYLQGSDQIRSLINQLPKIYDSYNTHPPSLSKITAKTLIVWGDRDELFPVAMAVEMYTVIANAYLWVAPNAGHGLGPADQYAGVFTQTALEFLQNEW
ncbi:MAG: alpha/beta hydrolase [Caldilineaceae bacterium]